MTKTIEATKRKEIIIKLLSETKLSYSKIGKESGCSLTYVMHINKKSNARVIDRNNKFNKDKEGIIKALKDFTLSCEEIAKKFNCSRVYITKLNNQLKIRDKNDLRKIREIKTKKEIENMINNGVKFSDIAKKLNISVTYVYNVNRDLNGKIKRVNYIAIRNLLELGMDYHDIVSITGAGYSTIYKFAKENKIR